MESVDSVGDPTTSCPKSDVQPEKKKRKARGPNKNKGLKKHRGEGEAEKEQEEEKTALERLENPDEAGRKRPAEEQEDVKPFHADCCPPQEKKKINKRSPVKILVWNRRQSDWGRRRNKENKSSFENRLFYLIKSPAYQPNQIVDKEDSKSTGADKLPGPSKHIKKKKSPVQQFLKHKDYKKFLQTYIHIQNLSNFKVDSLFNQEEESHAGRRRPPNPNRQRFGFAQFSERESRASKFMKMAATQVDYISSTPLMQTLPSTHPRIMSALGGDEHLPSFDPSNPEHAFTVHLEDHVVDDVANFEQVECPLLPADMSLLSSDGEYKCPEVTYDEHGKPRCTYTDLIERALTESGGLTVSEIYQWISDHYPFFRPDDDRWKNSVRHNLSINPYFKKGEKARSGAGHLWTISEESRALRPAIKRKESESQEILMCIENETDRAVANILGQYHLAKNGRGIEGISGNSNKNQKTPVDDNDCNTPPMRSHIDEESAMIIQYGDSNFQSQEYTIDLSTFQFPDVNFDDIMPGGLIVIQTDENDQDANKENVQMEHSSTDYMMEYSSLRNDSHITETERVSGQLISEALTQQGFEMHSNQKQDKDEQNSQFQHEEDQLCPAAVQTHQFETLPEPSSESGEHHEYMSLDSIDHIALNEVIHGSSTNGENDSVAVAEDQYTTMINMHSVFEHKDLDYCTFESENQVSHCP